MTDYMTYIYESEDICSRYDFFYRKDEKVFRLTNI